MVCYVKYVKNVLFAVLQRVMGKYQEIILNYYLEFCFSFHIFVAKYRQTPLLHQGYCPFNFQAKQSTSP